MKPERIRDPIHDIIAFDDHSPVDEVAWKLLETPDMQRLRRIKQLGVSEFVYPSASHSRFAHSIGVFHNARRLVGLIKREIDEKRVPGVYDENRAKVALFAALLHDIGHGPFSHAFEAARKALAGPGKEIRKHEGFSAGMVLDPDGEIRPILQRAEVNPVDVANMIQAETPTDMYHAVVSSSFDADRLDYLARDRYMTGTGTGAIDLGWLMANIRVASIDVSADDGEGNSIHTLSFCLYYKARDAAEDFLLARYRLYTNVYFHKTTRGFEQLISAFFRFIARGVEKSGGVAGIALDHPIVRFFLPNGESLANYCALDDTVVWSAIHGIAAAGEGQSRDIAQRILNRRRPYCLDVQNKFPEASDWQRRLKNQLNDKFKKQMGESVFRDTVNLSIYGEIGADERKAQKRLMIQMADGGINEITKFEDATITASDRERSFDRYYFLNENEYQMAQTTVEDLRRRRRP